MARFRKKLLRPAHKFASGSTRVTSWKGRDTRGRDDILQLVSILGITEPYRTIPDGPKNAMYERCLPPLVSLDQRIRDDEDARLMADGVREGLREMKLHYHFLGDVKIPLVTMYTGLAHLNHFLKNFCAAYPRHEGARQCKARVDEIESRATNASGGALEAVVLARLMPFQRFDQKLYGMRIPKIPRGAHQIRLNFTLYREQARRVQVEFQGASRPAYQCGGFLSPPNIKWVAWKPEDLDLDGPDKPLPVYVQSHAFRNFYERLGVPLAFNPPSVLLFQALVKPNVVAFTHDGAMLIECTNHIGRIGYFVVNYLGDKFLVNTFLFITMQGTPESQLLYEKLRLSRRKIEMMQLDNMLMFLFSDLRKDKKLAPILRECGLGHLLDMRDKLPFKLPALMQHANLIRKILGWAKGATPDEEEMIQEALSGLKGLEDFAINQMNRPGFFGKVFRKTIEMMEPEMKRFEEDIKRQLGPGFSVDAPPPPEAREAPETDNDTGGDHNQRLPE